jgi:hypothetical protein
VAVDEIETQSTSALAVGATPPVAQSIQQPKRLDARFEDTAAALLFEVLERVAGKGCDDFHSLFCQKFGRVLLAGLEEHTQVATVENPAAQPTRAPDDPSKISVKLRGPAGDVEQPDLRILFEQREDALAAPAVHLSLRFGLDST